MEVLRTPDDRFEGLSGYDFAPHYREVDAHDGTRLRLHSVDEGPRQAAPVLLLHGNPTWSYLYRNMIPGLVECGHRVMAPA
jgi:haloalkane dehalogenase